MPDSTFREIAVKIDQETGERIKRLAESRQRTSHWIVQEAIGQYLEREESRQSTRKEGGDAWDEYKGTGLHATGDEVTAWLESWGDKNEMPAPKCHK